MQVTGHQLMQAIKKRQLRLNVLNGQFDGELYAYEGEMKDPIKVANSIRDTENQIAKLEFLQSNYNILVKIKINEESLTLCEAIKRLGGAGRISALWAHVLPKRDRYSSRRDPYDLTRNKDQEKAQLVVNQDQLLELATEASSYAADLRALIAAANNTLADFPSLEEGMI